MGRRLQRTPRDYDGSGVTTHRMSELLSVVLTDIGEVYEERPDLVLASWPEVIGQKLAHMTQAVSFIDGVLLVKVRNSTLYSLLNQHDRPKILNSLRQKFPKIPIKNIVFRIG